MKRMTLVVRARQLRRSISVNGTQHVVVGEKMVEPQIFDRSPKSANSARVTSKLGLRVDDPDLHRRHPATPRRAGC